MALLFESLALNVLSGFVILFTLLYFYLTRHFNFWEKRGFPYVKPSPFYGNLKEVFLQKVEISSHLKNIYDEHRDKPYVGIFSFDRPTLLVNDPAIVKKILVKDSQNFINHIINVSENLDPMFAKNLFSLKGQKWRHTRVNVTPTFTLVKMKKMLCLVDNCAKELGNYLERMTADGSPVDAMETMCKFTTDSIATCAFGIESNSLRNPDAEIRHNFRKIFDNSLKKGVAGLLMFFAPHLQNFFRIKFVDDEYADFLRKTVWSTVEYREKNGVVRNDFLECLMELRRKGNELNATEDTFKFDGDDLVAMVFTFFFAGFETSATTSAFASYELALQPDIQNRLRKEITEVLEKHNQEVTYEAIQEMKYLDMVVSETLRKYPILGFLDRVCYKDYELPHPSGMGTITLPAGTGIYIPMLGIHLDPKYYPDPERFDPEHFSEASKQSRPSHTYFPFGDGPRNCIGMRFGLMQVKAGLINVLSRFEVRSCKDTPVPVTFDPRFFLIHPKTEMLLKFTKITAQQ